jgi:hypothetical protein
MKASERRLLTIFVCLLAVVGGVVLAKQLQTWSRLIDRQKIELQAQSMEGDMLLSQGDTWKQKEKWLLEHQPQAASDLEADETLMSTLSSKLREYGLQVVKPAQPLTPVKNVYASEHGIAITVKGDLPAVFRWIYSIQSPAEFRVVPTVKITPDAEDATKVVCVIEFWRWYRPALANNTPQ